MNIEESFRNEQDQRRINIMKSFTNLDADYIEKAFDGDLEKAKQYADNGINRKMNRVGQTYGSDGQPEENQNQQPNSNEENPNPQNPKGNQESQNSSKFEAPQSEESGERVEYAEAQLQEFAQQADDESLQRFLDDAAQSGDNSEYMQAQVNIAQQELNNRQQGGMGNENQMNQEQVQEGEDMNGEENGGEENSGQVDYTDSESVKNFLLQNPEAKEAVVNMMMEDVMLSPAQALRIHQAQTTSGSEALQHVEAAKQTLDELHAKLGGGASNGEENSGEGGAAGSISFSQLSDDDRKFFDAPEDAVIAHVGDDSAIYTASEGYLEIVYEDGNYKQFENVTSTEEAMKIVQENVTSEEAVANSKENEENMNQGSENNANRNNNENENQEGEENNDNQGNEENGNEDDETKKNKK